MSEYAKIKDVLESAPRRWLITGVAGFIGSNLLEILLNLNQEVVGLDNFATGFKHNLEQVKKSVSEKQWQRFVFIEGDICNLDTCLKASKGVDFILHQAALGSVPRSIEDPIRTHESNLSGFLNMLVAARDEKVNRFIYAASSSTYGDHPGLPKVEDTIGKPLSPYAVTKYVNELYSEVFSSVYGIDTIGLRYFNIFGRRQDPNGAYAAVIPKWFSALINGDDVFINGDGETSRDFCYIDNCLQANILAAMTDNPNALNQVYNIAFGQQTNLNELYQLIRQRVAEFKPEVMTKEPVYQNFRPGDVRHSLADISKASKLLDYKPDFSVRQGLDCAAKWYWQNL